MRVAVATVCGGCFIIQTIRNFVKADPADPIDSQYICHYTVRSSAMPRDLRRLASGFRVATSSLLATLRVRFRRIDQSRIDQGTKRGRRGYLQPPTTLSPMKEGRDAVPFFSVPRRCRARKTPGIIHVPVLRACRERNKDHMYTSVSGETLSLDSCYRW